MKSEQLIRVLAGSLTLLSVLLVYCVSPWWLLLTAFVGLNLFQAGITGVCPAAMILKKFGMKPGCAFS